MRPILLLTFPSRVTQAALAVLLGGALLAGCDPKGSAASGAGRSATADLGVSPASDYREAAPGRAGGTLRVSAAVDTASLDFHAIADTNAQWLGRMIYDNLVYLDAAGNITPWLARSWTVSPDGKTYTFVLRDDVTFSDGARFNAQAVLVNLEHMRAPATKSPLAAAYIAPYLSGKVVDEFTFQATLREPYAPFLNVLAQSWLSMASPKAILAHPDKLGEFPVGSGPFVVERYTRQQGIRFVRRAGYHWSPDVLKHAGPAYLERINVDFLPEPLIRYQSLAAGQYDFTIDAPPQNAAAIRADPALRLDNRFRSGVPWRGLTFNVERAPFDDVRVRRAVALAIDRDGIVAISGFGEYGAKTDFLAANTKYYDPSWQGALRYDVAAANKLFDAAGWVKRDGAGYRTRNGVRLGAEVLGLATAAPTPTLYAAMQDDLKKVGFALTITMLPRGPYMERRSHGYQALGAGVWHTNTPDALYINYDSHEITSPLRVGQNTSRLRDAALDAALEQGRRASDPAVLKSSYAAAQRRLTELVPGVPLFENYSTVAYRSTVKGVVYDTSHNTPFFATVWLQPEAP